MFDTRLESLLLDMAIKVLDGKQERVGDYIEPTREAIKKLFKEVEDGN